MMSSKRGFTPRKKIEVQFVHDDKVPCIFGAIQNENEKSRVLRSTPSRKKNSISNDHNLEEDDLRDVSKVHERPTTLFENGDVGGREIFGFQTSIRRNAMAAKAAQLTVQSPSATRIQERTPDHRNTPSGKSRGSERTPVHGKTPNCESHSTENTPVHRKTPGGKSHGTENTPVHHKTPSGSSHGTPSSSKKQLFGNQTPKVSVTNGTCNTAQTPYNLRKRFQKKLIARQEKSSDESDTGDFSVSDSDWDEEKSSSETSEDNDDDNDSQVENKATVHLSDPKKATQILPSRDKPHKLNYIPATEDYFMSCSSRKVNTSNHTLGKLRHRLGHNQLVELLQKSKDPHSEHMKQLEASAFAKFAKWRFLLREGFNIILYGLGSKLDVLNTFHAELPQPSIIVNGFFPGLTIQEIVSSIAEGILDIAFSASDLGGTVDAIKKELSAQQERLHLVIHNIDGVNLRNTKSQEILASLASAPNIHIIASIDHINAPFLWDQDMLGMFNFLWWDVTTFKPYTAETAFESSLLLQRSANLAFSSLQNVFKSLTRNAKSIFMVLAEYQKEHKNTSNYSGMPFKELYSACRESLLVSSDLALRSQLTEFTDHLLIKIRRGQDGSEMLLIPIDAGVLEQFMSVQEAL